MIATFVCNTPIGALGFVVEDDSITKVEFNFEGEVLDKTSALRKETENQIQAYFDGRLNHFDLPYTLAGTEYQQRVWQALTQIPLGSVMTYGALSDQLQSSARAIGGACRRNPVPVIVPCHRIVSASGIGGFAGQTSGILIENKQWLLNWEAQLVATCS
ncbi:methylated-DNA--[protein]-cysteine S-methyltransferase [Pleionea sp. CnH1-48]|uniref:methylated-DNA--[protein]-cysteine S-methyltransferase n=1 Tax=Pleionea sp. CnH1-48 TaxID=2954494 RepID=UPI0020968BF0|nr:methylated-DNA--[protein]-cysteine S-methyltransferase [Pleionea sp. CnH1-48]MCO7225516.1 methylated-DNA--[protein]-cysteine S-methyltransferase [Pleionea sp. CnH1-48]